MVTVKFAREFSIRFRTLNLGEEHEQERNAIAFNLVDNSSPNPCLTDTFRPKRT
jgi:hypothetical protein